MQNNTKEIIVQGEDETWIRPEESLRDRDEITTGFLIQQLNSNSHCSPFLLLINI